METDGTLRGKLRETRKDARVTQASMAERLGFNNHTQISKIERGTTSTSIDNLERWAAACGYEVRLVPMDGSEPDSLGADVAELKDPAARAARAAFLKLLRYPRRYWSYFVGDFEFEAARAARAARDAARNVDSSRRA